MRRDGLREFRTWREGEFLDSLILLKEGEFYSIVSLDICYD